jgi:hypothetical protein
MENFNFNTSNEKSNIDFFNPVIQKDTALISFKIPDSYIKGSGKYFKIKREYLEKYLQKHKQDDGQILDNPEVIDIDYQEINSFDFKERIAQRCCFFKDGILIHSNRHLKDYFSLGIAGDYKHDEKYSNHVMRFIDFEDKCFYFELEDFKKLKKFKNSLTIYVYLPKMAKNKLLKFIFENNTQIKLCCDYYDNNKEKIDKDVSDKIGSLLYKHAPEDFVKEVLYPGIGIQGCYQRVMQTKTAESERNISFRSVIANGDTPYHRKLTNKNCLLFSYAHTINSLFYHVVYCVQTVLKSKERETTRLFKFFIDKYKDIKYDDLEGITKKTIELMFQENLFSFDQTRQLLTFFTNTVVTTDDVTQAKVLTSVHTLYAYLHFTKRGTSLPFVGDINFSKIDTISCSLYWAWMSGYLLMSGRLEADNGPCPYILAKQINDKELNPLEKYFDLIEFHVSKHEGYENKYLVDESTHKEIKKIADEIEKTGTGEWIPYNAAFEIKDDSEFKYVRFIEDKNTILFFLTNQSEEVLVDLYDKEKKDFEYWAFQNLRGYENISEMYYKIISSIRDWKVLIDRDSTMTYRGKRVPTGVNTDKVRYIYLPRVRYRKNPNHTTKIREFYNENRKFSGERRAHVRRLPHGAKPSKLQLLLAEKNNVPVPENYTFVKESLWGNKSMTQKEIKYRTKSLHGLLFVDPQDMEKAEHIEDMSPAAFEENMSKFMGKQGWDIVERNNYDGGIDIRGFKEFKDGTIKKLIVQCKHWKKAIGPDVIRELIGAKEVEDDKYEKVMMVITSSRFTPGAIEIAEKHNVGLIDGDTLLNEME